MTYPIPVLLLFILAVNFVFAETDKPGALVILPAVGSAPETGVQFGAYVLKIFPQQDATTEQNRLELLVQGTSKGQYQAYLWPNLYLQRGRWQLQTGVGARYWPTDYFGEGNDTSSEGESYTAKNFESSVTLNRKLSTAARAGVGFTGNYHQLEYPESEVGALLNPSLEGYAGGFYTGIKANLSLDTRDKLDWPSQGYRIGSYLSWFAPWLGSDAEFTTLTTRGALYTPWDDDVLAIAAELQAATETTPFTYLPRPSGSHMLRGANGNRWIDQRALSLQAEYRATLSQRWALVSFADAAQLASTLTELTVTNFHYTLGGGVRFATTADRFNIRLDMGWVDASNLSLVISAGEAF